MDASRTSKTGGRRHAPEESQDCFAYDKPVFTARDFAVTLHHLIGYYEYLQSRHDCPAGSSPTAQDREISAVYERVIDDLQDLLKLLCFGAEGTHA